MARNELGMSFCARRERLAVAERLVANVLKARKRILGEEHAYTLWSINDLSKIFCERGRSSEAAHMLEGIIPIVKRTLGEDHVGMSMTLSNLSRAYALSGRWKEAEQTARSLLTIVPANHPDWYHIRSGYVNVCLHLGRFDEAEKDCTMMLDKISQTKVMALDHPRTLTIAGHLVAVYRAQGRTDDIVILKKKFPAAEETGRNETLDILRVRKPPDQRLERLPQKSPEHTASHGPRISSLKSEAKKSVSRAQTF